MAKKLGALNAPFLQGEIDQLPLESHINQVLQERKTPKKKPKKT